MGGSAERDPIAPTTPAVRSPGELNPAIQEALSKVAEFAALDPETQIIVTQDVASLLRDATTPAGGEVKTPN